MLVISAEARQELTELLSMQPLSTIVNMMNTQLPDLEDWERLYYTNTLRTFTHDKSTLISHLIDIAEDHYRGGAAKFLEFINFISPPVPEDGEDYYTV